jgi:hypothetical protein
MLHPSREALDHEVEQQTRLVRGLMAALYAHNDTEPDESLLRELAEAKETLRELQRRRDDEREEWKAEVRYSKAGTDTMHQKH